MSKSESSHGSIKSGNTFNFYQLWLSRVVLLLDTSNIYSFFLLWSAVLVCTTRFMFCLPLQWLQHVTSISLSYANNLRARKQTRPIDSVHEKCHLKRQPQHERYVFSLNQILGHYSWSHSPFYRSDFRASISSIVSRINTSNNVFIL